MSLLGEYLFIAITFLEIRKKKKKKKKKKETAVAIT